MKFFPEICPLCLPLSYYLQRRGKPALPSDVEQISISDDEEPRHRYLNLKCRRCKTTWRAYVEKPGDRENLFRIEGTEWSDTDDPEMKQASVRYTCKAMHEDYVRILTQNLGELVLREMKGEDDEPAMETAPDDLPPER